MPTITSSEELASLLDEGAPIALLDVREHGEYNLAHIPGACPLPRRLIEYRLPRLVPNRATRIIVCDDDGRRAALALGTLERMGYENGSVLDGGINRWTSLGYGSEWGVNVPSKDFGERLQVEQRVPEITAEELEAWISRGEQFVMVDSRTPEEHNNFCIPGSRSLPGGELALRIWDMMDTEDTPVVVHCAGRTRSIVGTGLLQRMGVRQIYGLRNGTMGWQLAGFDLEKGSGRVTLNAPSVDALGKAEAFGRRVAEEDGVNYLTVGGLQRLLSEQCKENVYLVDVRTREEFESGHIPGFWWHPGGQAVQESDNVVGVKAGQIVFCCDGIARASVTGSFFRQMGYPNVQVVEGGTRAWEEAGMDLESGIRDAGPATLEEAQACVSSMPSGDVASMLEGSAAALFVGTSGEFSEGHPPGSRWVARGSLELLVDGIVLSKSTPLVIMSPEGRESMLAAFALVEMGYENVVSLEGGTRGWAAEGRPLEMGLSGVMTPPDDLVATGSGRNFAGAIEYLRWEEELGRKYERD